MPPPPDEFLQHEQITLSRFVGIARRQQERALGERANSRDEQGFICTGLAGRIVEPGMFGDEAERRISINIMQSRVRLRRDQYTLDRDIDSIIGISKLLPYKVAMAIFPLARFNDALTRTNHMKAKVWRGVGPTNFDSATANLTTEHAVQCAHA